MPRYSFVRQNKRIEEWECKQLLEEQSQEMKAIISLLYLTGARISEVLKLTPRCITDLETEIKITLSTLKRHKRFYNLSCAECGGKYRIKKSFAIRKCNKRCKQCGSYQTTIGFEKKSTPFEVTRTLTFERNAPFMDIVLDFSLDCTMGEGLDAKMFRLSRQLVGYYIWKVSKTISPHCFRHSRLQKLADKGAPTKLIQQIAGHASITSSEPYIEGSEATIAPMKKLID